MNEEEKAEFISNIVYYWSEKGNIEKYCDYSPERLREADPLLASAYEQMKIAKEIFSRLISGTEYED